MVNASVTFGPALTLLLCCCCGLTVAQLANDLLEFKTLVPRRRIEGIAAKYYIFDLEFRDAANYLRSKDFIDTLKEMQKAEEVAELIHYLESYSEGEDLTPVLNEFRKLRNYRVSKLGPEDLRLNGELTSFLDEVIPALSRSKIHDLIERKMRQSRPFRKFYRALKNNQFKNLLISARFSPQLRPSIRKLSNNEIDANTILEAIFELLSWGPNPTTRPRTSQPKTSIN
ncbi:hypothetical protein ACLKA6_007757 [Drosophila palustris]